MMKPGIDYGVEVISAWDNRRVGQVFYPPGLLRDALVRSGRVKRRTAPPEDVHAEHSIALGDEDRHPGRPPRKPGRR